LQPGRAAKLPPINPNAFSSKNAEDESAWRDELARRLETYRGRKRRHAPNAGQSRLPFENNPFIAVDAIDDSRSGRTVNSSRGNPVSTSTSPLRAHPADAAAKVAIAATESPSTASEEFSFTIAIGRPPRKREDDTRMVIDVSLPPEDFACPVNEPNPERARDEYALQPVASIEERQMAAVIDVACLLFAYGGILALFGAVGGEFTINKLSGAVGLATFAIVYLQYFALFTIFGGTTPGMMLRGLQVVGFSGEPPTPRQMLMRSAGYMLSAGTFFLGFLWSMWDEDSLTWHDRISRTYLHSTAALGKANAEKAAPIH
jgi:uncharacterized RDD family membrane protein YckC